jgi:hypothetical protein
MLVNGVIVLSATQGSVAAFSIPPPATPAKRQNWSKRRSITGIILKGGVVWEFSFILILFW